MCALSWWNTIPLLFINIIKKIFTKINKKHIYSHLHSLPLESEKIYKRISFISNQITSPIANNLWRITPALYNINKLSSQLVNNKQDKIEKNEQIWSIQIKLQRVRGNIDWINWIKGHKEHEASLRQIKRNQPTNPDSTTAFANHHIHLTTHHHLPIPPLPISKQKD